MNSLKHSVLILGEGPTEFYYFQSLRDKLKSVTIRPDYPKHTNLKELEVKIVQGINEGYDSIYCVIDMDTKTQDPEKSKYLKLKQKYSSPINKPRQGICCEVQFFETHRCTELFFLYYFDYTSKFYPDQPSLIHDLNNYCIYEKKIDFFKKCKGLHNYFLKNGGDLNKAIENSLLSMREKVTSGRDYTYSDLGDMINKLLKFRK